MAWHVTGGRIRVQEEVQPQKLVVHGEAGTVKSAGGQCVIAYNTMLIPSLRASVEGFNGYAGWSIHSQKSPTSLL